MKTSIWKKFCLVLPLVAASVGSDAWGQAFTLDSNVTTVSNSADEVLFDTALVTPQPNCVTTPPYGAAAHGAMPSQPQMQQPLAPDTLFNPAATPGALSAGQGALTAQTSVASLMPGGYLDPAAPVTMFRLRYDDGINNRFPDRGEYFYAKCGCFRDPALAGNTLDPNARGPQGANLSVNYQDVRPYFEYAFNTKFSVFTELPVRFVSFNSITTPPGTQQGLGSEGGLSDMNVGFKYAFVAEENRYWTFQLRTYIPTGDSYLGLGTGHVSIEPSLLYYRRLTDRLLLQGQFTEFAPVGGSGFASNVLQYGGGLGYILHQGERATVIPTLEMVGWTFIGGQEFNPVSGIQSASGDTIVNIKPGVRIGIGRAPAPMAMQQQSIYAGFGIPVTGDQFYSNLFRVEYRYVF